jgi:predicted esterase YcpF (UPF0227 family)
MILYIHGFGSHGYGGKAKAFRDYYAKKNEPFFAPSLSYIPELAMQTLEELLRVCDDVKLIGSSLGGYYAMYLAQKYDLKAALINPAMHSHKTLRRMLGMAPNIYDGSRFEWKESHLKMLEKYETTLSEQSKILLLVQTGDEVLDYRESVETLSWAKQIVEEGGSHGFDGVERYFDMIDVFLSE